MKLSEKIQAALREQLEDSLSDPSVQRRLAAHWGYVPAEAQPVPREAIDKMLTQLMDIAVSNGANSISMPDEYVEVAAWLCGIPAQPAPSVPDGWKLVPIEPTKEMLKSGQAEWLDCAGADPSWDVYQAMVKAAPETKS